MLTASPNHVERGFTMVELIVVMVLLTTALALMAGFFVRSMGTATHTSANGRAQGSSNTFLKAIGSDVRQAMAPSRSLGTVTKFTMRKDFRTSIPAAMQDIVVATESELWLRTDALADTPGKRECVGYVERTDGLHRLVYETAASDQAIACPRSGGAFEDTILLRARPASAPSAPRFRYAYTYNPDVLASASVRVDNCRTVRPPDQPSLSASQRLFAISAVVVEGTSHERGGEARMMASASYPLVSRQTATYQHAVGCAY